MPYKNIRIVFTAVACALAAVTSAAANGQTVAPAAVDSAAVERVKQIVGYLASDECAGRRVGTEGCELAAKYLEQQLTDIGVEPVPDNRGYRFGFSVTRGIQVSGKPKLLLFGKELTYGTDYTVASFSGSGNGTDLPLVFAGYGIVAPEMKWNDYEGIDPDGAAVVIIRGEPQLDDPDSLFAGTQPSVYSDLRRKASTARDLGAAAVIVVNNPFSDPDDVLPELKPTYSGAAFNIPVVHVKRAVLMNPLIGATGLSWHEICETMDLEYKSMPAVLGDAAANIDIEVEKDLTTGFNLVGVIPGSGPELSKQYIVIGAHYDHLGTGGSESSRPDMIGQIHPGADDNASGCSAVLEIARWAKQVQPPLKRSILVCLFSGEEVGAVGSAALAKHPPVPHEQIDCMLNFDMVGRLREGKLLLGGAGTALEFDDLLAGLDAAHDITFSQDRSGFGGSDHLNFMKYDDPVLFFFTGAHPQYHSPLDTADLVNDEGIVQIAGVAEDLIARVDELPAMLTFERPAGAPVVKQGLRASITVSMGTIPSFEEHDQPGYLIDGVRPDAPADKAGMQGGDLVIKIGDRKVANIYDFMYAMQDIEPGETKTVTFIRDGKQHEVDVKFEARAIQE